MHKKLFFSIVLLLLAVGCSSRQTASLPVQAPTPTTGLQTAPKQPLVTPVPTPLALQAQLPLHTVGQISRHNKNFINQRVRMQGYVLKKQTGYVIVSDEPGGAIGRYDLPVTGPGIETMQPKIKYELQGLYLNQGLNASNSNPDHLELEVAPKLVK